MAAVAFSNRAALLADANGLDDIFIAVPYAPAFIPACGSRDIDRRWRIIGVIVIARLGDGAAHYGACRQAAEQADGEVASASSCGCRHQARADCNRGETGSKAVPVGRRYIGSHGMHPRLFSRNLDSGEHKTHRIFGRNGVMPINDAAAPSLCVFQLRY
jgi:hypothetical protein